MTKRVAIVAVAQTMHACKEVGGSKDRNSDKKNVWVWA
jgi:hypothetical protein